MNKNIIRILCAMLALLVIASAAALAATETKTYKTYEPLDAQYHTVIEETWVYPIVNGKAGSGKPASDNSLGSGKPSGSNSYKELHTFENGVCIHCGYASETFTNAMGIVLVKGMPAADVLKQVVNAIPAGVDKGFVGVTVDAGDNLLGLVENNGAQANFIPALAAFPAQTVDGVPSNVVTLAYADAQGKSVVENYAFSTADATLVKLY